MVSKLQNAVMPNCRIAELPNYSEQLSAQLPAGWFPVMAR
jgi:hypothetical protein